MDLGLHGSRAVITGGSAGLGLAVAHRLVDEGAGVGLIARSNDALIAAAHELRADDPAPVVTATADVTDSRALATAVDAIADELGGLDLVVANAGGSVGGGLLDGNGHDVLDDYTATYALNAGHAAALVRAAHPYLVESGGGSVVLVSSVTGVRAGPSSSYAAAKAAEIHLAAALALELAADGIRVNAVSPGSFVTDESDGWGRFGVEQPEAYAAFVEEALPLGRLGRVGEVADVVTFLLSPRASWVNGANVAVDGAQQRPSARTFAHRRTAD